MRSSKISPGRCGWLLWASPCWPHDDPRRRPRRRSLPGDDRIPGQPRPRRAVRLASSGRRSQGHARLGQPRPWVTRSSALSRAHPPSSVRSCALAGKAHRSLPRTSRLEGPSRTRPLGVNSAEHCETSTRRPACAVGSQHRAADLQRARCGVAGRAESKASGLRRGQGLGSRSDPDARAQRLGSSMPMTRSGQFVGELPPRA